MLVWSIFRVFGPGACGSWVRLLIPRLEEKPDLHLPLRTEYRATPTLKLREVQDAGCARQLGHDSMVFSI